MESSGDARAEGLPSEQDVTEIPSAGELLGVPAGAAAHNVDHEEGRQSGEKAGMRVVGRVGFMKGRLKVPEDFDIMGQREILEMFGASAPAEDGE